MIVGTLRDQIIYPNCHEAQVMKGISDSDLAEIMSKVSMAVFSFL